MQLNIDYSFPHGTLKSGVTLASSPVVEAAITAGQSSLFGGADLSYNSASNQVTKWILGAGALCFGSMDLLALAGTPMLLGSRL